MTVTSEQRQTMVKQIGMMNVMAISGGRVGPLDDGIELPVGAGYRVRVRYVAGADHYSVERVFVRSGKVTSKGLRDGVYADEVGETAYMASCFRNDDADYWPEALTV